MLFLTNRVICVADDDDRFKRFYLEADSVKELLNQSLPEKRIMEIYFEISGKYGDIEQDSVIAYALKSKEIAQKLNVKEVLRRIYINLGLAYSFKNSYDSAYFYFDLSREAAISLGNKEDETLSFSLTAFTYAKQGKYNTAIDYFLKVLKISENKGWTEKCVMALTNLSEINRRLGNTETAIQYLKQTEEKCKQLEETRYSWRIPHIYNEYAFNYLDKGDLDKALYYALKADSVDNIRSIGTINRCYTKGILANVYLKKNDSECALHYAGKSYKEADILKDKNLYAYAGKIISDIYMAQNKYPEAEAEALKIWMADSTQIDESRAAVENIALANIFMGNTEKAAYYLKRFSELNKQYSEKSFQTTVSDLAIKYEIEKKEMRIASLEQQKILYIVIGIASLLFAIVVGLFSWHKMRREQLKKQLIAANAIVDWEEKERKRFANELHDGINGMLSALKIEYDTTEHHFNNLGDKLDDCIETIRRMAHGMMPASLERFGMKAALEDHCRLFPNVQFHFFGEERRIEKKLELVIFFCAYELVNNSTRHSGAKNINVQLIQGEDHVSLTVQDDGCGFNPQDVFHGSGLKNINDRVSSLNGKFDIDSSPGKGTESVIELRIKNQE